MAFNVIQDKYCPRGFRYVDFRTLLFHTQVNFNGFIHLGEKYSNRTPRPAAKRVYEKTLQDFRTQQRNRVNFFA